VVKGFGGKCKWFSLKSKGTDAEEAEMQKKYSKSGTLASLLVRDFRRSALVVLKRRLGERFSKVTVSQDTDASVTVKVSGWHKETGPNKEARVYLEAIGLGDEPIRVKGKGIARMNPANLAWMIAVVIGGGLVVGVPIMMFSARGLHKKALETAIMRAFDEAALKLADELYKRTNGAQAMVFTR